MAATEEEKIFKLLEYIYTYIGGFDDNINNNKRMNISTISSDIQDSTHKIDDNDIFIKLKSDDTIIGDYANGNKNVESEFNTIKGIIDNNYTYTGADTTLTKIMNNDKIKKLFIDSYYLYLRFVILDINHKVLNASSTNTKPDGSNYNVTTLQDKNNLLINDLKNEYQDFENTDIQTYYDNKDLLGKLNTKISSNKRKYTESNDIKIEILNTELRNILLLIVTIVILIIISVILFYDPVKKLLHGSFAILFLIVYYSVIVYINNALTEYFSNVTPDNLSNTIQDYIRNIISTSGLSYKIQGMIHKEKNEYNKINNTLIGQNYKIEKEINDIKHRIGLYKNLNELFILSAIGFIVLYCVRDAFVDVIILIYFILIVTIFFYKINQRIHTKHNRYYWTSRYKKY